MSAPPLPLQLEDIVEQFRSTMSDVQQLVEPLSDEQLNWRPATGAWSIGECVEHLSRTNNEYVAKIDRAREETAPRKRSGDASHTILGRLFLRYMEPPVRRRVAAPGKFQPAAQTSKEHLLAAFDQSHRDLAMIVFAVRDADLGAIKISSPVSRSIRFNLLDALSILAAHERRHVWQARNVAAESGFPR